MSRTRRNLTISLLISGFLAGAPAQAVSPQFSLSLDLAGYGLFSPVRENLHGGYGGSAFFDIRPFQVVSAGFGFEYIYFPGVSGVAPWKLSSINFGGRLFPMASTESGEFYLLGGVGLNLTPHVLYDSMPDRFYGTLGFGYRMFLKPNLALDFGGQYNYYSPLSQPLQAACFKMGFAWVFGTTQWPLPEVSTYGTMPKGVLWRKAPQYVWQAGDDLRRVSNKLYGEDSLYSLLVDANRNWISEPRGLTAGVTLKVPELPFSVGDVDAYRDLSLKDKAYLRWANLSEAASYRWGDQWRGPSTYLWRNRDTLPMVAERLYGDEDMYPLLVDANEDRLIHPASLVPGVRIIVPRPQADRAEAVRAKARGGADPYLWWKNVSEKR